VRVKERREKGEPPFLTRLIQVWHYQGRGGTGAAAYQDIQTLTLVCPLGRFRGKKGKGKGTGVRTCRFFLPDGVLPCGGGETQGLPWRRGVKGRSSRRRGTAQLARVRFSSPKKGKNRYLRIPSPQDTHGGFTKKSRDFHGTEAAAAWHPVASRSCCILERKKKESRFPAAAHLGRSAQDGDF